MMELFKKQKIKRLTLESILLSMEEIRRNLESDASEENVKVNAKAMKELAKHLQLYGDLEMKIEEAIEILEQRFDSSCRNNLFQNVEKLDYEDALWMAISALRSATREQVEKVCRGEWLNFYNDFSTAECSKCGELFEVSPDETPKEEFFKAFKEFYHFCPSCGAPMTDDANCTARVNFRRDSRRTIMKIEKVIKQLESIADHTRSMAASPDADNIWRKDIDALEFALTALRSMQEAGEPIDSPPAHIDRRAWTAELERRLRMPEPPEED